MYSACAYTITDDLSIDRIDGLLAGLLGRAHGVVLILLRLNLG
jgi:hypothetical protein